MFGIKPPSPALILHFVILTYPPSPLVPMLPIELPLDPLALPLPAFTRFSHFFPCRDRYNSPTTHPEQEGTNNFFHYSIVFVVSDFGHSPVTDGNIKAEPARFIPHRLHSHLFLLFLQVSDLSWSSRRSPLKAVSFPTAPRTYFPSWPALRWLSVGPPAGALACLLCARRSDRPDILIPCTFQPLRHPLLNYHPNAKVSGCTTSSVSLAVSSGAAAVPSNSKDSLQKCSL